MLHAVVFRYLKLSQSFRHASRQAGSSAWIVLLGLACDSFVRILLAPDRRRKLACLASMDLDFRRALLKSIYQALLSLLCKLIVRNDTILEGSSSTLQPNLAMKSPSLDGQPMEWRETGHHAIFGTCNYFILIFYHYREYH